MPDDHSKLVPLLPIPNRTVKRLSADDSAGSRVKVGHCQAINEKAPVIPTGAFFFADRFLAAQFASQNFADVRLRQVVSKLNVLGTLVRSEVVLAVLGQIFLCQRWVLSDPEELDGFTGF